MMGKGGGDNVLTHHTGLADRPRLGPEASVLSEPRSGASDAEKPKLQVQSYYFAVGGAGSLSAHPGRLFDHGKGHRGALDANREGLLSVARVEPRPGGD